MPRPLYRAVLLLGAMTFSNCARVYAQAVQTALRSERVVFRVRIYNDEGVPEGNLLTAQKVADAVLERSGLEPMWQECTVNNPNRDSSGCDIHTGGIDLVLYLVAQLGAHAPNVGRSALGYSVIPDHGELATMAYVCYGRVRAVTSAFASEQLFGLAMAHEIGHLLFGSRDHANQGIMRAKWQLRDLENGGRKLRFTQDQSRHLRAAAQARLRFDELGINRQQMTSHQSASQRPSLTDHKNEHRIPFRARNGFVYIPARVNGSQATLLLDTGAALTTFSLKIAPTTDSESRITIHMAKGSVAAFRVPAGFTLGDSEFEAERYSLRRSVVVGDFNFGEADGVIGLDILSSFKSVTIDFQNSILILEDR